MSTLSDQNAIKLWQLTRESSPHYRRPQSGFEPTTLTPPSRLHYSQ